MTVTAVIAATTAADTTVEVALVDGESKTYGGSSLTNTERVLFEQEDSSGGFSELWTLDEGGTPQQAVLHSRRTLIRLYGPLEFRINKPATQNAVEVVEYT